MNRSTQAILTLFLIIGGISLLNWQTQSNAPVTEPSSGELQPNYSLTDISSTLFDERGNIAYTVTAEQMSHYEQADMIRFVAPQYALYTDAQSTLWQVNAKHGELIGKTMLVLEDGVEILSTDKDGFVRRIETQRMQIDLTNKKLVANGTVKILGDTFAIVSQGIRANLETQTFELSKHVKTQYQTFSVN